MLAKEIESELRTSELRLSLLHGHYETGNKLSENAVKVPNCKDTQDKCMVMGPFLLLKVR